MALVTIGIPAFNEAKYLRETLDSALSQTFGETEIIVCDNCSTDDSYSIASEYAEKDQRIKAIRHHKNIGALENFDFCLGMAKTKYFVWLGGHDLFTADYIALAVAHLEEHSAAVMVYPRDAIFVDSNNKMIRSVACSNIESRGDHSPVHRMTTVVANLGHCTNIHGVFLTSVAKKLPFEKVAGPDNLQLALTALFGEIHALPIVGIRRREVRIETLQESKKRWTAQGLYVERWYDPRFLLIWKHIEYVSKSREITLLDKVQLYFLLPWYFHWVSLMKGTILRLWSMAGRSLSKFL